MAAWFSRNPSRFEIAVKVGLPLLILLVVVGGPIWWVVDLFQPNTRMYFKGCVTATANLDGSVASYVHLEIGSRDSIYTRTPRFELKFEDGTILDFPDLDMIEFAKLAGDGRKSTEFGELQPAAIAYSLPGCYITIANERVLQVTLRGFDDSTKVALRTASDGEWRSIRFSDEDLWALFGEPDWVKDDWRH